MTTLTDCFILSFDVRGGLGDIICEWMNDCVVFVNWMMYSLVTVNVLHNVRCMVHVYQ